MKNTLLLLLATIVFITSSCSEQERVSVESKRVLNFKKYINPNLKAGSKEELVKVEVKIIVINGSPKIISDEIEEKVFEIDGRSVSMFSYKKAIFVDNIHSLTQVGGITNRAAGWHDGYLFDGGRCFVYCRYFENPNGSIVPWSCCGDSGGNCVGLDPICGAWA